MNSYDYPLGADTKDAPWNQEELPEREIEVTVSVTLSKTVKIKVSDYTITDSGKDEDGEYFEDVDYSDCDLIRAVKSQHILPQDIQGWNEDDIEVIIEE